VPLLLPLAHGPRSTPSVLTRRLVTHPDNSEHAWSKHTTVSSYRYEERAGEIETLAFGRRSSLYHSTLTVTDSASEAACTHQMLEIGAVSPTPYLLHSFLPAGETRWNTEQQSQAFPWRWLEVRHTNVQSTSSCSHAATLGLARDQAPGVALYPQVMSTGFHHTECPDTRSEPRSPRSPSQKRSIHNVLLSDSGYRRVIIESFRLEETFKIIEPNH